jgi:hypothetical protein
MAEPSQDWKETLGPDEDERFARLGERLVAMQTARPGKPTRALHGKGHAGLRARVRVLPDLPAYARQGFFAEPTERRAYVRFSNGAGSLRPDREPDLRGLAVKVLDVDGPKVLGDARTQDFLMIDSPTVPFRSPEEFVAFVTATAEPKGAIGRVVRDLGLWRTLALLGSLATTVKGKPRSVVDRALYSAAAVSFGPYAARYAAFPVHTAGEEGPATAEADYLRVRTSSRVAKTPLEYELRAQFFTGAETPVEDSSVAWPSPFVPVARLTIEAQDPTGERGERLRAFIETLSFDPWHALVVHKPLGAVMRARKHAYYASIQARGAAAEPDGTEWASFD